MAARRRNSSQKTLVDTTADQIIDLILEKDLQPGVKLPTEAELTQLLGVGRSTVREAVRRLVTRNILSVRQGSGIFVSQAKGVPEDPLGVTFFADRTKAALELSDVRLMLEPELAAAAVNRATDAQLTKLKQACALVEECIVKGEDYRQADIDFHRCIAECSGNHVLENIIPVITSSIELSIEQTEDVYRQATFEEHQKILAAILRRDAIGARFCMAAHLNTSRDFFARKAEAEEKKKNASFGPTP